MAGHRFISIVIFAAATGCAAKDPVPIAESSPFDGHVVAIAPILNFSGAGDLDPVRVADLLASELGCHSGVTILPVNRVVAELAREGKRQVESAAHALYIARHVGADRFVLCGITEYDPYTPLVVGLAIQVYAPADRRAKADVADPLAPIAQYQRVYNAAHDSVVSGLKKYASNRDADQSPYRWRRYTVSQELFLRYCCWDAVGRLNEQDRSEPSVASARPVR